MRSWRAVNSFGFGGSNAHAVLQALAEAAASPSAPRGGGRARRAANDLGSRSGGAARPGGELPELPRIGRRARGFLRGHLLERRHVTHPSRAALGSRRSLARRDDRASRRGDRERGCLRRRDRPADRRKLEPASRSSSAGRAHSGGRWAGGCCSMSRCFATSWPTAIGCSQSTRAGDSSRSSVATRRARGSRRRRSRSPRSFPCRWHWPRFGNRGGSGRRPSSVTASAKWRQRTFAGRSIFAKPCRSFSSAADRWIWRPSAVGCSRCSSTRATPNK